MATSEPVPHLTLRGDTVVVSTEGNLVVFGICGEGEEDCVIRISIHDARQICKLLDSAVKEAGRLGS